jgi:hypothetical protein
MVADGTETPWGLGDVGETDEFLGAAPEPVPLRQEAGTRCSRRRRSRSFAWARRGRSAATSPFRRMSEQVVEARWDRSTYTIGPAFMAV